MTDDEIRAAFSTHPDHGATVRMIPEADYLAAMQAKDAEIAELMKDVTFLQSGKDLIRDELHWDDHCVNQFAKMMREKMAASRAKGRSGWDDPAKCSVNYLRDLLYEHLEKGDPVDVANICMMLRHYDASTVRDYGNDLDMWKSRAEKAEADLATSRAETAMAFEVSARDIDCGCRDGVCAFEHACPKSDVDAIRALTTADATAALAARDKSMRFKGRNSALREAMSKFYPQDRTVYETKDAREKADAEFQASALRTYIGTTDVLTATTWAGKQYLSIINGAKDRILSLIQEENQ